MLLVSGTYTGTIDFLIVAFGKGTTTNIDTVRNQIIEVIEETLDNDITRNGNALDTQIIEASTDEGTIYPYGGVRVTVRVIYEFIRGSFIMAKDIKLKKGDIEISISENNLEHFKKAWF